MSDGTDKPETPPITKPPFGSTPSARPVAKGPSPRQTPAPARPLANVRRPALVGVTPVALIGVGAIIVVLSFVAAFLGATLARSGETGPAPLPTAEPTVTATSTPPLTPTPAATPESADSPLSLGVGAPADPRCASPDDVYIDTENLDFYQCADGQWMLFSPTDGRNPLPTPTTGTEG